MTEDTISCELHDFVEVACMYHYQLKLILKNEQMIEGTAIDIVNTPEMQECLIIDNDSRIQIELTQLVRMEVLTPNAKFREVIFE
ncbi:Rho-binding antiterminator [Nitrosomonas supralitoralis]|uniref:Transcriptional regulator n=1 Tax=Nitrosomonas supralitoralis TaxID=2116706 RepID=A0A2P7NVE3_9PROT|nr:Rho-binding antiterminator [Nitrosomonas supralitoralis]PSJ17395.1 transcriptional regulator [Nitrosomonas supralitoralis]